MTDKHSDKDGGKKEARRIEEAFARAIGGLLQAVSGEVERRAKEAADKKPLSKMSDADFQTFVAKAIAKGDHDDE